VPYEYDSSGLRIVANGREFGIGDLVPGYASSAGFRVGDIIVAMDGRSVAGSTLADVRRGFKSDGRDHTLTIARYGAIETVIYRAPAALTPR
jgi:C-terminal processing protease CtpA/Prc